MWAFTWTIEQRSDDTFRITTALTSELERTPDLAPTDSKVYPSMAAAAEQLQKYVQGGDTVRIFAPDGALVWKYVQPGMSGY